MEILISSRASHVTIQNEEKKRSILQRMVAIPSGLALLVL
jgi:hypothetical protein